MQGPLETARVNPSQAGLAAHAERLLGDVEARQGNVPEAGVHYRVAVQLAEPRGMCPLFAHCHAGLGKLYRRTGKIEQAREHLTIATTMYREMDMRFWLEQAETDQKQLGMNDQGYLRPSRLSD